MTLLRQLVLIIVTLFILLFAGTFAISVSNTRDYLSSQLQTISQDTATSLGLTLSPHFAEGEMVIVESMISAVFDSGYYREVIVRSIDNKPLVERIAPVNIEGVPAWFVRQVPLETPRGEALIMAGWQQAGTVTVSANPGQAFRTLWTNSVQSFWWFLGSSLLTLLLGIVALKVVLRPLHAVEAQAKAICDREYPIQREIPWTVELRNVVEAMNRMTLKVREMFQEQAESMERMHAENYCDTLTGLANRRYFDMQLRYLVDTEEDFHAGALILLEISNLQARNAEAGYFKTDELLAEMGKLIREKCAETSGIDYFAAHIAGADFAIVLSGVAEADVEDFVSRLMSALPRIYDQGMVDSVDIAHAGVALYHNQSLSEFLSEADTALRQAQVQGPNSWHISHGGRGARPYAYPASQWQEILLDIIRRRRFVLYMQPIQHTGAIHGIDHREILLRILDDQDNIIPAAIFIPMAKRLGLVQEFDKLVIQEVMSRLERLSDVALAINLFPGSVADASFNDWLLAQLRQQPRIASRLIFEIAEYGVLENAAALRSWVDRIRSTGARTSIDHFGKGFASFGYLCETRIDYLKIDGSFISDIEQNKDHRFFVESIIGIAHGLDIKVVAESVETEDEMRTLTTLGVDALQGYGIQPPVPWQDE